MYINQLNLYYQNVRGLRTKLNDIYNNSLLHDFHMILITESWLKEYINDSEILCDKYTVYRHDRSLTTNKKDGGGVLIGINKLLESKRLYDWENDIDKIELLWIELKTMYCKL